MDYDYRITQFEQAQERAELSELTRQLTPLCGPTRQSPVARALD
jgi:hypothetical protein